jgi:hypothetical protein
MYKLRQSRTGVALHYERLAQRAEQDGDQASALIYRRQAREA